MTTEPLTVHARTRRRAPSLQAAMITLALTGLGIATYLTVVHYTGGNPVCTSGHGCETVQHSRYAKLAGIPVAVIGLAGYAVASLLVPAELATLAAARFSITGLAFSAYLTYREIFTIKAICQWCVASALIMAVLAILATLRYLREDQPRAGDR
jgi:uncharacterized membrane protein